ncbi:hypothetical protein EMCRGX_G013784 [Ephydatia muelleri]
MGRKDSDTNCTTVILKFILFLINCIILVIGLLLIALGAFVEVEKTFTSLTVGSILSDPGAILIIAGSILVIIGGCGCIGALLEVFLLLCIFAVILSIVTLAEIAGLIVFVVQKDIINEGVTQAFDYYIAEYYNDIDKQNIIDLIQISLQCCGSTAPNGTNIAPLSWEANPYFNCSSAAYQKCSVPYSCCIPNNGSTIINLQCGYGTLDNTKSATYIQGIQLTGCADAFKMLLTDGVNYQAIIGGVCGLILVEVVNIAMALSLAIDVYRERKAFALIKLQEKQLLQLNN